MCLIYGPVCNSEDGLDTSNKNEIKQEYVYEDDVSAEEAAKKERTWLSEEDEDCHGPQCPKAQKAQRQEKSVRIGGLKWRFGQMYCGTKRISTGFIKGAGRSVTNMSSFSK